MTNTDTTQIRPFTIDIPQDAIDDLQARLANTRYPEPAPGDDWSHGTPVSYLRDMVDRWRQFDWREQEARMNAVPNYVTEIDGQTIHFVHVRSAEADATPLLLLHTYPGSFAEFLDMIGPLTDPVAHGGQAADAFHVVVPSMPGFGFSTPVAPAPGGGDWTMAAVARAYDTLMRRLGYDSYGTHGSDGGAMVSRELAVLDPPGFLGAHVLQLFSFPSGAEGEMDGFGPKEYAALEFLGWFQSVGGYNGMNGTRPQTVAAALSDSPVGQLAYNELFENFGNGTSLVSPEQVLTQVSLYWLTNTSAERGPVPLRGGALRRRAAGQPRPDRRRRVQGRLPDDPAARRARQHGDRALDRVRPRRPLRGPGGAGARRRRPAHFLHRLSLTPVTQ